MNDSYYVNESEVLKSASLIDGYVAKEMDLINSICDSLKYGFDGTYNSSNYSKLVGNCNSLRRHASVVVENNKKITQTLKDVCNLYTTVARKQAIKLRELEDKM